MQSYYHIFVQIIVTFYHATGPWYQDFCHRVTKLIVCPTHLRNFMADTLIWLDITRKMSLTCLLIVPVKMFYFSRSVKAELIKLAKMAGVMHEADHAYSIQSTW